MDYIYPQFYINIVTPPDVLFFKIYFFRLNFVHFPFLHCLDASLSGQSQFSLHFEHHESPISYTSPCFATGIHNSVPSLEQMKIKLGKEEKSDSV